MPEIISPICTAIKNLWDQTPKGWRLYLGQAPQGTTGKWGTYNFDGGRKDEISDSRFEGIENAEIRFNLYCDANDGGQTISEMQKLLTDVYDWAKLSIPNFQCVKMQRTATGALLYVDEIWQIAFIYEVSIG